MTTAIAEAVSTDLAYDEAQAVTSRIRSWVKAYPADDVAKAYLGRIWLSMGYDDWAEWCDCELDGFKLPAVERREVVADLTGHGLSNRAIADALNVDAKTIRNDKGSLSSGGDFSPPDKSIGQDGKTYTKPAKPEVVPGFTAEDLEDMKITDNPQEVNQRRFACDGDDGWDSYCQTILKGLKTLAEDETPERREHLKTQLEKIIKKL